MWSLRSTAATRIFLLICALIELTCSPLSLEFLEILKCNISTLPLAKGAILIADGNWNIRDISSAVAYSGFIIIASPNSFLKNSISSL